MSKAIKILVGTMTGTAQLVAEEVGDTVQGATGDAGEELRFEGMLLPDKSADLLDFLGSRKSAAVSGCDRLRIS